MKFWQLYLLAEGSGVCEADGFLIRAEDEEQARIIARDAARQCGLASKWGQQDSDESLRWLDSSRTSCTEVPVEGEAEVVLLSYVND